MLSCALGTPQKVRGSTKMIFGRAAEQISQDCSAAPPNSKLWPLSSMPSCPTCPFHHRTNIFTRILRLRLHRSVFGLLHIRYARVYIVGSLSPRVCMTLPVFPFFLVPSRVRLPCVTISSVFLPTLASRIARNIMAQHAQCTNMNDTLQHSIIANSL